MGARHALARGDRDFGRAHLPGAGEKSGGGEDAATLAKLDYGNGQAGKIVDRFWLDGPLEISPVEQVDFLGRLLAGKLPVSAAAMAGAKEIIPKTKLGTATVHYKTGWSTKSTPQIGWLVGWLETAEGKVTPFALNIDMADIKDAEKRLRITLSCLEIAK